jgi:hypothetical protein
MVYRLSTTAMAVATPAPLAALIAARTRDDIDSGIAVVTGSISTTSSVLSHAFFSTNFVSVTGLLPFFFPFVFGCAALLARSFSVRSTARVVNKPAPTSSQTLLPIIKSSSH